MFIEQRMYTAHPGKLPAWLRLYEEVGGPCSARHLGPPIGFFTVEFGTINRVLFVRGFDDGERATLLALLTSEARHRGLASCVMTFEPHPRDYFAQRSGKELGEGMDLIAWPDAQRRAFFGQLLPAHAEAVRW